MPNIPSKEDWKRMDKAMKKMAQEEKERKGLEEELAKRKVEALESIAESLAKLSKAVFEDNYGGGYIKIIGEIEEE